jgi:hypothetical protein
MKQKSSCTKENDLFEALCCISIPSALPAAVPRCVCKVAFLLFPFLFFSFFWFLLFKLPDHLVALTAVSAFT